MKRPTPQKAELSALNSREFIGTGNFQQVTPDTDKTQATVIAQLALRGHAVHKGNRGDFTVSKHGLSRYCKDLGELHAFARQVGATQ